MPVLPEPIEDAVEELVRIYRDAWLQIVQEQERLLDPRRWRRRQRLTEMRRSIESILTTVDASAREWMRTQFPLAYAIGAQVGAQGQITSWAMVHEEAVKRIAKDAFDDLLKATQYVRQDTKRFIREYSKLFTERKLTTGQTAIGAARKLVRQLIEDRGITAVVYKNGARYGLDTYGEMVVRTKTAVAYNEGTLNGAQEMGTKYVEVFDGPDCGWARHEDTDLASGKVIPISEARAFPIAHPNCRRAFGPRPDVTNIRDARRLTDEARAAPQIGRRTA